jgi:hypothetical protein
MLAVILRMCQPSDIWQLLANEEFSEILHTVIYGCRNDCQQLIGTMEVVSELHEASREQTLCAANNCYLNAKETLLRDVNIPIHDVIRFLEFATYRVSRPGNTVHWWVIHQTLRILNTEALQSDNFSKLCAVLIRAISSIETGMQNPT